jgi:hypothetical protein
MMAGGGDTVKRYLTSVMSQNYLYTLEVNCGRQAVYDEWTKCKFQGGYWRRGRRPDGPGSKWLEKVSKDDGATGITQSSAAG